MRRSLSIIAAAAMAVGASAVSLPSTQAAVLRPAPVATDSAGGAIVSIEWQNRDWGHGDSHSVFRDDRWDNGWRHRRHHRFRHHGNYRRNGFHFGFPFAFRPQFYPYPRRGDCFRTWEGYVVCR